MPKVLRDPTELAQEVSVTDRMATGVLEVRAPEVMNYRSVKFWQNPHSIGCLRSSVPMASIVGEEIGTGDMKPMSGVFHSHAGLINMEYQGILQEFSDSFFDPGQILGTLIHG
jgi:hypothetical protein